MLNISRSFVQQYIIQTHKIVNFLPAEETIMLVADLISIFMWQIKILDIRKLN